MRFLEVADEDGDGFRLTKDFHENDIPRPYAILSHTWGEDGDEVTFQDMQQGSRIDKPGFEKIRFCARQARCDGIKFFWIDTCCIDKKDLVELQRAINSMFRWYKEAKKCYVYLSDVPRDSKEPVRDSGDWQTDFRRSRWFERGWTLQELLAPASVEFFSRDGVKLGSKASLVEQIRDITNVPVAALQGNALSSFSREERFSWQEDRQTKEDEDTMYSLLGIFGVSMPVIYGEGRRQARARLDREIDIAQKGTDHKSFSVTFASPEVAATANFVARESELQAIHEALRSDGARRSVTIHGLGGMGKTQLAIAYATRYRENHSAVFWVNAKDEDSLKLSFGNIAKQIAREHPSADAIRDAANSSVRNEAVDAVRRWLSLANNTRWLIIYDNYDNPKIPGNPDPFALDLRKFVPESHQGCLIVTTRSSEVRFGQRMRIRKLETLDDSLAILSNQSDRKGIENDPGAIELVKKLDGLPLALATAGAYLRQTSMTFAKYFSLYQASWAKLQKTSPCLDSYEYEDRQLYSTWQISFDQIQQRNEGAAQLLRLWAYFDNEDIWYELLCDKDENTPPWLVELTNNELAFNNAVRVLCDHGIVDAHPPTQGQSSGYSMHSCVHSWTRDVLNAEPDEGLARTALFCVANLVPVPDSVEWWVVQRRLFNHANRQLHEHAGASDDASWAFHRLGVLYGSQGKLAEAEKMYSRALQGKERELGPDHTSTLETVHNLGLLYCDQGKLAEAEKLHKRALQGRERELGPEHMSTLNTVNNLGVLYSQQGKLAEAEKMLNRTLQGCEGELGPEHISTLQTVNNLGILYWEQGKLAEAEKMYNRALQGYERELGPEHMSTLNTMNNLGLLYQRQGKLAEAEKMFNHVLQGRERNLGPDHTSTLEIVHNFATLYSNGDGRRLLEAEAMFQRALQGCERALGSDHAYTLDTVYEIGRLYAKQGRLSQAEQMHQRLVSAQDNLSTRARDRLAYLEEELRAAGADIPQLRRSQASDASQQEEESEAFDRSDFDDARGSDRSQLDASETSDQCAFEEGPVSRKRQCEEPQASRKRQREASQVPDQRRYNLRTTRRHSCKK